MCRESDSGKAAVYARISVSHDDKKDMTIDNQIMIAKRYIENHIQKPSLKLTPIRYLFFYHLKF